MRTFWPGKLRVTSSPEPYALTQEAWAKGTPLGSNADLRLYDFGTPVAIGPGGGGYQTQIHVSMDAKGQIHGSPWGRVHEGPLPQ